MRREELVSMLESLEAPLVDAVGHEIAVGQAAPDDSSAAGSARMWQFYWALAGAPAQNEEAEGPALQSPQGTQDHAAAAAPAAPAAAAAPAAPAAAIVHGPVASNVILEWILQARERWHRASTSSVMPKQAQAKTKLQCIIAQTQSY
eukprot:GHVT01096895.1.p1 GENE.GHVT01096895.1~~GHVT01096895.1.p1  ORF type:complete len:147 (+),score=45.11 GHVT01096895.1:289-729(+)